MIKREKNMEVKMCEDRKKLSSGAKVAIAVAGISIVTGIVMAVGIGTIVKTVFVNEDWGDEEWSGNDWAEEELDS